VEFARLVDAAGRVATAARRFGVDKGQPLPAEEASALLLEAAAAGFTLVRNENAILPLDTERLKRIAVIGPNSSAPCFQGGTFAKIAVRPDAMLPIDALRERFGDAITVYEPGVDPQPKLPRMPARPARALDDGCTRGMTLDYFDNPDCAGAPLLSETRDTNSLTWFHGVHPAGALQQDAATRASGVYTALATGPHRFYVGGTGALLLLVDGVDVFRRDEALAPGDVMGRLKSGDADCVSVELNAGQEVEVVVELRYTAARCQGLWYGPDSNEAMLARAVAAARAADAVVLVVGETSDASVESKDRQDTRLPPEQLALIGQVCAANPNTVIVTNVGHAFDTRWEDQARAVLHCWYPGEQFGPALAMVLAGDREPGGRMPVTIACEDQDYPALSLQPDANGDLRYDDGVRIGYRGLAARGINPRKAFGSGFGYTSFALDDAAVEADGKDGWIVSATLRNTGERTGAEVVQVYRAQPELTLVAFEKVRLAPGEARVVRIPIERRRLQVWDGKWTDLAGRVDLLVGRSSADLPLALQVGI
jgi:beta-glucosidase